MKLQSKVKQKWPHINSASISFLLFLREQEKINSCFTLYIVSREESSLYREKKVYFGVGGEKGTTATLVVAADGL